MRIQVFGLASMFSCSWPLTCRQKKNSFYTQAMSEYLVDENKNLVPYSEPSGTLPVIVVSMSMNVNKVLYCNDYGNSKNYILDVIFSGSANDKYFSLRAGRSWENVGYLVTIIGRGYANLFNSSSNQLRISVFSAQITSDSPWYVQNLGVVLDDSNSMTVYGGTGMSWNGAHLILQCIKLW